jgi:DNA recombination protein RmuC
MAIEFAPGSPAPLVAGLTLLLVILAIVFTRLLGARQRAAVRAEAATLRTRVEELKAERDTERARADEFAARAAELQSKSSADAERVAWLNHAEHTLRETFESLASRTLQRSTETLTHQSRSQLDQFSHTLKSDWNTQKQQIAGVVEPVREELRKLDTQIRSIEEKRQGAYQGLSEQIQLITEQYRTLQHATTSLDQALRAPNVRGKWGEVQIKRIVELAGMSEHVDYDEQSGDGGRGRPDMVVRLPGKGIMPVDAKAPMNAYLEAQEAASPELGRQALKRHSQALRSHVQLLSNKAYWSQFERSPEFVVLVVPYESGLAAAFQADADLLEYALANRVVIASPVSFLALLRVVGYGWMQVRLSENAQKISATGRELLERLGPFADHLNAVGDGLNQATERFNAAAGSFERRVLPTARRLHELGAGHSEPPEIRNVDNQSRRITRHE